MVAGASAWPQWVQRLLSRDQIESMKEGSWKASPFSLGQHAMARDQDVTKEELKFMAEFSRFMNYRIPHLLQVWWLHVLLGKSWIQIVLNIMLMIL